MANRFYAAGGERARKVRELFEAIAHRYDLINDLQSFGLHRRWKRQVVELARLQKGERALDICCGTGDLALSLAESGAMVVGLDFSLAMLTIARRRTKTPGSKAGDSLPNERGLAMSADSVDARTLQVHARRTDRAAPVLWIRGDALGIPFRDSEFDVVTIGYGLRNLEDPQAGLEEMRRVLKPGGRLLILDFGKPDHAAWRKIYFAYLRWCVPWFGRLFCGDSQTYAYILESLLHYPAQRGIADLMQRMHFSDVRVVNFLGGIMSINYGQKCVA
ncbi:MAG: class I SAM-dependent methyltransferase [Verrucomicrobia bacterium]|nr:class I SAM-dependent methyltransferase [Verrucomicrobiota bacterium]